MPAKKRSKASAKPTDQPEDQQPADEPTSEQATATPEQPPARQEPEQPNTPPTIEAPPAELLTIDLPADLPEVPPGRRVRRPTVRLTARQECAMARLHAACATAGLNHRRQTDAICYLLDRLADAIGLD
jgi:hypothetical protein